MVKLRDGATIKETSDTPNNMENIRTIVHISIPYDGFRIFGLLDDTGFCTIATGIEICRMYGFYDNVQCSIYSTYFCGHGLKVQVITLPNGMIGSAYVETWRVSDAG